MILWVCSQCSWTGWRFTYMNIYVLTPNFCTYRYGLPVNFQAVLMRPQKKMAKRLREVLNQLYSHLDNTSYSGGTTDVSAQFRFKTNWVSILHHWKANFTSVWQYMTYVGMLACSLLALMLWPLPDAVAKWVRVRAASAKSQGSHPGRVKAVTYKIDTCCYLTWRSALIG